MSFLTKTDSRQQRPVRRRLVRLLPLVAALAVAGCGMVNQLNRPTEAPTAVPPAIIEVFAEPGVNPDIDGQPKPVLLRVYELRATAAFERAGFVDLQEKDEAQLSADLVGREEFILRPGQRMTLNRKGNADVRSYGFFAGYRDLERSVWRTTVPAPNSVEMRRRWFGLGPTERLQPVRYVVTITRNAVRVQAQ